MNPVQVGTSLPELPLSIHDNQYMPFSHETVAYHGDIGTVLGSGIDLTASRTRPDLSHWEPALGIDPVGLQNQVFPASESSIPFDMSSLQSNDRPLTGQTYVREFGSEENTEDIPWQEILAPDTSRDAVVNDSSGAEVNPMFASLLKQLSLDLPNTDEEKGIQKNDSFSKWASNELDEVVDDLNPKSAIHWDEIGNVNMGDNSVLCSEDHQAYVMSPSLSQDQLFSINCIFPSWSFAGSKIMVFVSGSFLVNKDDIHKHNWSCMFGQEEVPAEVVADGVLRCLSPVSRSAQVPFYVTCSNRFPCSEVREFEFRVHSEKDFERFDPCLLSTYEMLLYTRLDKILSMDSPLKWDSVPNLSAEKTNMCNKISSLLTGTNDELSVVLKKATDNDMIITEKPNDHLMQTLLKDKLHSWLLNKVVEGDKGPSILDKEGQGVIHLAACLGYNWAIAPLIAAGLNINFRDVRGWTALHWAASYGRESTIVALLSLGAASGLVTDPTPEFPSGRTPADLASCNGHKGIAGFLAESSLTTHLSALNLRDSRGSEQIGMPCVNTRAGAGESNTAHFRDTETLAHLSLKDSLSAVQNAAQAFSRIYQVYRVHSFHRKKRDEYGEDKFATSDERILSLITVKANKAAQHDQPIHAAAVKIQKKFRGWKGRKDFLIMRRNVVKIQAHVRGYQVRKHFRKIVWSVGIVEKAILRWRRKGCGLRGFRSEGLTEGTRMQVESAKEDDYDFFREGRKQSEARLERALARVRSMVQYPEARDQYRRLLTGVEEFQESKVILERILNDEETTEPEASMMFDIDELLEDDIM